MKDYTSNTIALFGIAISAAVFKEDLELVQVDFGILKCSILQLVFVTLGLLGLSVYFFLLDYVKYGFTKIMGSPIFRYIQIVGHLFFTLAVLSPIFFLLFWFISKGLSSIIRIEGITSVLKIIGIILSIIGFIISLYYSIVTLRRNRSLKEENLEALSSISLKISDDLYRSKRWDLYFLEIFKSLEYDIGIKLVFWNINYNKLSFRNIISVLESSKVLDRAEIEQLVELRRIRNSIIYSNYQATENDVKNITEFRRMVVPKLKSELENFEKLVLFKLQSELSTLKDDAQLRLEPKAEKSVDAVFLLNEKRIFIWITRVFSTPRIRRKIEVLSRNLSEKDIVIIIVAHKQLLKLEVQKQIVILYYDIMKDEFYGLDNLRNLLV